MKQAKSILKSIKDICLLTDRNNSCAESKYNLYHWMQYTMADATSLYMRKENGEYS